MLDRLKPILDKIGWQLIVAYGRDRKPVLMPGLKTIRLYDNKDCWNYVNSPYFMFDLMKCGLDIDTLYPGNQIYTDPSGTRKVVKTMSGEFFTQTSEGVGIGEDVDVTLLLESGLFSGDIKIEIEKSEMTGRIIINKWYKYTSNYVSLSIVIPEYDYDETQRNYETVATEINNDQINIMLVNLSRYKQGYQKSYSVLKVKRNYRGYWEMNHETEDNLMKWYQSINSEISLVSNPYNEEFWQYSIFPAKYNGNEIFIDYWNNVYAKYFDTWVPLNAKFVEYESHKILTPSANSELEMAKILINN